MHTPYEGLEFLERILEQEPRFWPAMIPISYGYKQIGQFERAYEALTKCYEIQPNNPDIASELGICAIHLGKYKEGERYLLQAVNASPTHKGYLKNLATYYSAVPKKRRALEIIDKLLELYPDDEELQAFRQEVEFARGNTWERFHGWWSVGMTRLFDKLFSHLKE
jgi:Flp pilus assembly protein TadD